MDLCPILTISSNFADLSSPVDSMLFLRNHHYEQHSELRKTAGQLRGEEVEAIKTPFVLIEGHNR